MGSTRAFSFGLRLFLFRRTSNALGRIRDGFQAGLGDFPAALFAPAITSIFDPLNRRFNLVKGEAVSCCRQSLPLRGNGTETFPGGMAPAIIGRNGPSAFRLLGEDGAYAGGLYTMNRTTHRLLHSCWSLSCFLFPTRGRRVVVFEAA